MSTSSMTSSSENVWYGQGILPWKKVAILELTQNTLKARCKKLDIFGRLNSTAWHEWSWSEIEKIHIVEPFSLKYVWIVESNTSTLYPKLVIHLSNGDKYYMREWYQIRDKGRFVNLLTTMGISVIFDDIGAIH